MVQFWGLIVVVLFVGVQLFQWLKGAILPLPLYVMAGAFLAIASNYDKGMGRLLQGGEQTIATLTDTLKAELDPQTPLIAADEPSKPSLSLPEFVDNGAETSRRD